MSTLGDIASHGAPVLVAVVAIGVSSWQQSKSRRFDRDERQKEREHDRLMRERAEHHERAMSELDYRRALVDDVNAALEEASRVVAQLTSRLWLHGRCDHGAVQDLSAALTGLRIAHARTCLRFGPAHDAVGLLSKAVESTMLAYSLGAAVVVADAAVISDSKREQITRVSRDLYAAIKAYVELVGKEVGASSTPRHRRGPGAPELDGPDSSKRNL